MKKGLSSAIACLAIASACSAPAEPVTAGTAEVAAQPGAAPATAIDPRVAEVLAAAKKRLVADRALIENRPGYERALERQRRQRVDSGMQARLVPAGKRPEALAEALRKAAEDAALIVVALKVEAPAPPTPVPAEHRGDAPYAYTSEQLFASYALTAHFGGGDDKAVGTWLAAVERAGAPLPFIDAIAREGGELVVRGRLLGEIEVVPPRHVIAPLTIEALAAGAGVEAPPREAFGAERETIDRLIAEHTALLQEIDQAMATLGVSHLEAERFRLYARAADRIDEVLGTGHGGH